jgi:Subtilase family
MGGLPKPTTKEVGETALDLEMVSAACAECHILLVVGSSANWNSHGIDFYLYTDAIREAIRYTAPGWQKADVISDSWNAWEFGDERHYDSAFDDPGLPIVVASGDFSYLSPSYKGYRGDIEGGLRYPASSPDVISVGGTTVEKREGHWAQRPRRRPANAAEDGTGDSGTTSGCSVLEPKPPWQKDTEGTKDKEGCNTRTVSDVAGPAYPLSAYSWYGWEVTGGTSAAAPFIAGTEAMTNNYTRSLGAQAFYIDGEKALMHGITQHGNGECGALEGTPFEECEDAIGGPAAPVECGTAGSHTYYLCHGEEGYDAPAGYGAPEGEHVTLTKPAAGPITLTGLATSSVGGTELTVEGTVNPEGAETEYYVEYGATTSYGTSTGAASAGGGTANIEVAVTLTGLSPGVTYDYRLVARNVHGTQYGANQAATTFATRTEILEPYSNGDDSGWKVTGATYAWEAVKHTTKTSSYISASDKGKTQSIVLGKEGAEWRYKEGWTIKNIIFKYISDSPSSSAAADIGALGTFETKSLPTALATEAFSPVGYPEYAQEDWEHGGPGWYPFEVYFQQLKSESSVSKVYAAWVEVEVET